MTIVFKISDNLKDDIINFYKDRFCSKTPPYAVFQVKDFDCVTTLYESGKIMFQGLGADIEASYWIEQERIKNKRLIDPNSQDKKEKKEKKNKKEEIKQFINLSSVGSDEVGTGDYFGPLVVTASFVPKEQFAFLEELGVKDSKKLTDEKIIKIAPSIIKNITYTTLVLDNKTYNDYHSTDVNMNKIKAILHNKCLLSVIKKDNVKYDKIVVDQFEPPKSYYAHLNNVKEKVTNITFLTKAEDQCFSVAASSIISRYIFLREIKKLEKKYEITIPLGAGDAVNRVAQTIVDKYGKKELENLVKLNFKNTEKVLSNK